MKRILLAVALCAVHFASAQIRIIPQDVVRKAADIEVADNSLQFRPNSVDFGTIDEMSGVWQGGVKLRNLGADTLVVTQVKTTCGCLKAEPAKRLLAPKEELRVELKYYPRGHAGRVKQRVLVYTNRSSEKPSAVLNLTGMVTASQDRSDDYPYTRGVLRLRQEQVSFNGRERQVQRIACMNGGSTLLKPTVDGHFLPKGVRVKFEPAQLASKQEGDIVVEYLPQGEGVELKRSVYINGLGIAPRESAIEIVIGK